MSNSKFNLALLYKDIVERFGSNNSLFYENEYLTFDDMDLYSSKVANYFAKVGLKNHDVVAISPDKSTITYVIILACIKCGITYSFFDTSIPVYRLKKQFQILNPKYLILHDKNFKKDLLNVEKILSVDQIKEKSNLESSTIMIY